MSVSTRIANALLAAIEPGEYAGCPPLLAKAIRYAVFPGGARVRPRLVHAVAQACGDDCPQITDAAAASIELLHCASLVHDDMPCFDAASTRRGKPSVHIAFGERLALLAGDAMIVMAFETLAETCIVAPSRLRNLIRVVGAGVGTAGGIVAGQAWECEPKASLSTYQQAKTGALFAAATMAGAAAAGELDTAAWGSLGAKIGEAYQVADDILDVVGSTIALGKPTGRDAELGRLSAVQECGMAGAVQRLKRLVGEAVESIPMCDGAAVLRDVILAQAQNHIPSDMLQAA